MHEWLFTFGVILLAGLCGAGFLGPFISTRKLVLLAAPLVGILLVVLGANAFYCVLDVSYTKAATLSAAACLGVGGIAYRNFVDWWRLILLVLLSGAVGALAVWTIDRATLRTGGPAVFYMDGTDHGGYAQAADWLNDHPVDQVPAADPSVPYESWTEILFRFDPRFGSFGLLAIISRLYGSSSIFSYDVACAVVLAAACLSVAAVFAPNAIWLAALTLGLFISNLYDYAHCGFFGKLVAYPSALMLAGLVLNCLESPRLEQTFTLALLASAVGLMHSGTATTVLMAPILGFGLIAMLLRRVDRPTLVRATLLCATTLVLPVIASGILARPTVMGFPHWDVSWSYELPRLADLENQGVWLSGFEPGAVRWLTTAAVACWAAALVGAVVWRSVRALGLLAGPVVLAVAMAVLHNRAGAFQLLGFIYPATLCGMVALFEQVPPLMGRIVLAVLAIVAIGLRIPRFDGSVSRYATHAQPAYLFTQAEIQRLVSQIGTRSVEVDVSDPHDGILLLIELGRRHLNVHWSREGWKCVVGYRQWPWKPAAPPAQLLLKMDPQPIIDRHFDLITNAT